ncbi:MAG: hypothetical protein ABJA82_00895 [Myxococcales bacterium]
MNCSGLKSAPPAQPPKAPPAGPTPPLCVVETTVGQERSLSDRTFPPQNWFVLMLHAYRSTGEIARPLNDCSGSPVEVVVDGCEGASPTFIPTELTPQDLVVASLGDARRLVWVITERLSDGQGQGPVAIAEVQPHGLAVRALGVLRVFPEHVSLRLERLSGATVLVADGQLCEVSGTGGSCEHAIRIVPLVADRFLSRPLVDDKGTCVGSSLFPVRTKGRADGAGGAKYEMEASVTFSPNSVAIREHLALSRAPKLRGSANAAGESFVERLQLERQLSLRGGRLITDGPSLLTRWLAQQRARSTESMTGGR